MLRHRFVAMMLVASLGSLFVAQPVAAQTPPAPAPATPPAPPPLPLHEGSAEFAFVGTTGNSSTQTIGLGGELIYRPAPWEAKLKLNYVRNESEDVLKAQSFVLTFRAQRPLREKLAGY